MSAGTDTIDNFEGILLRINGLNVSEPDISVNFSLPHHVNERIENLEIAREKLGEAKEKKKLKKRRRPRNRTKNKATTLNVEINDLADVSKHLNEEITFEQSSKNLTIQAIRSQKNAIVVRKRNVKCRHINLYTFLNSDRPYVFVSRQCRKSLVQNTLNTHDKLYQVNSVTKPKNGIIVPNQKNRIKNETLQSSTSQGKNRKRQRKRIYSNSKSEKSPKFEDHLQYEDVDEGLYLGRFVKGVVRINPKNYQNAYVSNADRTCQDYMIHTVVDRNRALEGDVVVLKIKPESEWKDEHKSATVVHILQEVHPRTTIGTLSELYDRGKKVVALLPRDKKMPRIIIPRTHLPPAYRDDPKANAETLYMARITEWPVPNFATGIITETIGQRSDLKTETRAILMENQLSVEPFPVSIKKYLPKSQEIPQSEIKNREDLRRDCVFTIDPLTARDLDDAVSCKTLPNGNLEVGVHIADVSFFFEENTELDSIVSKKATTIYLVDNVYHMLPVELCLHCSLLPGKDALAFSVFWEMNEDGKILSHRFSRTVINSCCQLSYEHAQQMIDNPETFDEENLPDIYNDFGAAEIRLVITKLKRIARHLRDTRFQNGALKLDQVKLTFRLDQSGGPSQFFVYENKESHRLIEELMLLANITVAQQILDYSPELAFLRSHEEPKPRLIAELQKMLEVLGIHIDITTSGALNASLQSYSTEDYLGSIRNAVLNHLLAKPMIRARYFCASDSSADSFHHYALSVPIYTHFTSPIRRYADIMVHRLLSASLGYTEKPSWKAEYVQEIADICNRQKYNAKRAGEASSDLFLVHYVESHRPFVQDAVVINVKERSFDVLVLNTGSIVRLFTSNLGDAKWQVERVDEEKKMWRICISYPATSDSPAIAQVIELFQIVQVNLTRKDKTNSLKGDLVRPGFASK